MVDADRGRAPDCAGAGSPDPADAPLLPGDPGRGPADPGWSRRHADARDNPRREDGRSGGRAGAAVLISRVSLHRLSAGGPDTSVRVWWEFPEPRGRISFRHELL